MGNLRRWALLLAMVGWLAASGTVSAQKNREPARTIQDDVGLFSAAAKDKANAEIADIKRQFKKDFFVETVAEKKFEGDKAAVNLSFNKWAAEKFKNQAVNGIYLVLVKDPGKIRVVVGPKTLQSGLFTSANRDELVKIIGAKIKDDPDGALQQGTAYVHRTLNQNARPAPGGAPPPRGVGGWPPWATYLCIGLVVLLVIWLVMGVARGLSGAGAGGGGGGGGGGFMSGMLGGLFGAMAGMWLYNNLFGGHTPSAGAADGGYDGGTDVGGGDPSVGGDDFGGGGGGGDVGGGDWGGGGGGDWGGGGGDFGGGGGDF